MEKIKVLMLGWEDQPSQTGGVGQVCAQIVEAVSGEIALDWVRPKITQRPRQLADGQGIYTELVSGRQPQSTQLPLLNWRAYERKLAADNPEGYALIHAHDWPTYPLARLLAKRWQVPLIIHSHSTSADRQPGAPSQILQRLEGRALEQAAQIIVPSQKAKAQIWQQWPEVTTKTQVITNHWQPIKPTWIDRDNGYDHKRVLMAGRVSEQKGWADYLKVAKQLLEEFGEVEFWLIGQGPDLRSAMLQAKSLGLARWMHYSPMMERNEFRQQLALVDVALLPSNAEPFGMICWDLVVSGVPMVLTDAFGFLELFPKIPHAPAGQINTLAKLVSQQLRDKNSRESFRAYYQKTLAELDEKQQAQQLIRLYQEML